MPTASELVQLNVARALKQAVRDNRGNGGANQETAAMRGVIDFLKSYMKTADAKGGGAKMRGEAATLALQAIAFANKCGGVDIKFNSDGQDVKQEDEDGDSSEDEVPASSKYNKSDLRKHDKAVSTKLVGGEQLYGRTKYLEKYKLEIYYEEENQKLETLKANADNNPMKDMILEGIETTRDKLAKQKVKCEKMLNRLNRQVQDAEKSLIKDDQNNIVLQPEGSTVTVPLAEDIVMIDENRDKYYHEDILPSAPSDEEEASAPAPAAAHAPATPVAHNSSDDDDDDEDEKEVAAAAKPAKRKATAPRRGGKKQK